MIWDIAYIVMGLGFLTFGGDILVRGSVSLAIQLGLSPLLVGMVVVGFGTSAPELLVSISATLNHQPDIAVGNIVGSNIANFLLILGFGMVLAPMICSDRAIKRDAVAVVCASLGLLVVALDGTVTALEGSIMLVSLLAYLGFSIVVSRRQVASQKADAPLNTYQSEAEEFNAFSGVMISVVISVIGIILLVIGADFLIFGATNVARAFSLSEAVIGLSLVAVGTSLPELAATIAAAMKRHTDVIIGNIMGSTLFNILSIVGITAMISPLSVDQHIIKTDIPLALLVVSITAAVILAISRLTRLQGIVMLISYVGYIGWLFV
jgi:cation:H+ antiporter